MVIKNDGKFWHFPFFFCVPLQSKGGVYLICNMDIGGMDEHRMDRRSKIHHYCWPGTYHVTIKVNTVLHQPLGTLHAILVVHRDIVSSSGRLTHLGQVIAGFKKGCNRRFWEMTGQRGELFTTRPNQPVPPLLSPSVCPAVHPQAKRTPSSGTTGRTPLFSYGYVDVMPVDEQQKEQQRKYIHDNPRSRLLRSLNRDWLQP